jgi:heat shock protein HtpX
VNTLKTTVLLAAIAGFALWIGSYFFGPQGAVIGLGIALLLQAVAYFNGHKMALAFARAQELAPGELPWLHQATAELSQRAGIPAPRLFLSPDPQPNAFAAGRNPGVAVVCINEGLLNSMNRREVIAVVAHEIGHIRNRDTLTMTVVAAFATFISFLANIAWLIPRGDNEDRNPIADLAMMLLAPIVATLIQLSVSRTREFAADRAAAELTGDPNSMIHALEALERGTKVVPSYTAQPATAHMYIAAPFTGRGLTKLFMTHPPIEDRIRALAELKKAPTFAQPALRH